MWVHEKMDVHVYVCMYLWISVFYKVHGLLLDYRPKMNMKYMEREQPNKHNIVVAEIGNTPLVKWRIEYSWTYPREFLSEIRSRLL